MPSLQNQSADLFRFAILFKFGVVRVLSDGSKERNRSGSRDQMRLVRRDRGIQEVVGNNEGWSKTKEYWISIRGGMHHNKM